MINRSYEAKREAINPGCFRCLDGKDVITSRVSDHHPIIHNGALFWNVMMQGKIRTGRGAISYNNGFGMVENDEDYLSRLKKIANVIAEIVYRNPAIEIIGLCEGPIDRPPVGLCEGPIEPSFVKSFLSSLRNFDCMERFFKNDQFYQPNVAKHNNWGLLMLTDKNNIVSEVNCDLLMNPSIASKLANRFQLWRLTRDKEDSYFALAHFPFGGDEYVVEASDLSGSAQAYCGLINHLFNRYANERFVFCADFNFNPYLIKQWNDRVLDQIMHHNSILINTEEKATKHSLKTVTVDGILLSTKEKQILHSSLQSRSRLFGKLKNEYRLFKSSFNKLLEEKFSSDLLPVTNKPSTFVFGKC